MTCPKYRSSFVVTDSGNFTVKAPHSHSGIAWHYNLTNKRNRPRIKRKRDHFASGGQRGLPGQKCKEFAEWRIDFTLCAPAHKRGLLYFAGDAGLPGNCTEREHIASSRSWLEVMCDLRRSSTQYTR